MTYAGCRTSHRPLRVAKDPGEAAAPEAGLLVEVLKYSPSLCCTLSAFTSALKSKFPIPISHSLGSCQQRRVQHYSRGRR